MTSRTLVFLLILCIFVVPPAFAYGDPTGGMLFRTLTPMLAVLWGVWLIVANNLRKYVANLISKFGRGKADEPHNSAD
ncbi:MAG TPA: hypothetical protein VEJ47_11475 [Candidatus Eremiobacteraceae bacterium]|nr:hypothetical protein [Candidatus Eremiobacteraceae bacterium]